MEFAMPLARHSLGLQNCAAESKAKDRGGSSGHNAARSPQATPMTPNVPVRIKVIGKGQAASVTKGNAQMSQIKATHPKALAARRWKSRPNMATPRPRDGRHRAAEIDAPRSQERRGGDSNPRYGLGRIRKFQCKPLCNKVLRRLQPAAFQAVGG
jgi:hypothetical protein